MLFFFDFTDKNVSFYCTTLFNNNDFKVITVPLGGFDLQGLNDEIERDFFEEVYFTKAKHQFVREPNSQLLVVI